jgi:hypothetical protein
VAVIDAPSGCPSDIEKYVRQVTSPVTPPGIVIISPAQVFPYEGQSVVGTRPGGFSYPEAYLRPGPPGLAAYPAWIHQTRVSVVQRGAARRVPSACKPRIVLRTEVCEPTYRAVPARRIRGVFVADALKTVDLKDTHPNIADSEALNEVSRMFCREMQIVLSRLAPVLPAPQSVFLLGFGSGPQIWPNTIRPVCSKRRTHARTHALTPTPRWF